jgi:hypothetical protein
MDTEEHFFGMVGQMLDDAGIGGLEVCLTLTDGRLVEGDVHRASRHVLPPRLARMSRTAGGALRSARPASRG